MSSEAHEAMNYVLRFLRESRLPTYQNIFKVHVTHWDLDGWGCVVALEMIRRESPFGGENLSGDPELIICQNPQSVAEDLRKHITQSLEPRGYERGKDLLEVLVTDLCPNPQIFVDLANEGHKICYGIIDHHQNRHNYTALKTNGIQMFPNMVYVNTEVSATLHMANFAWLINREADGCGDIPSWVEITMDDYPGPNENLNNLVLWANQVSLYDTGNWGEWYGDSVEDVDSTVAEQLYFARMSRSKVTLRERPEDLWVEWVLRRLVRDPEAWEHFEAEVEAERRTLMDEYEWFVEHMTDLSVTRDNVVFEYPDASGRMRSAVQENYEVKGVVLPGDEGFTLRHFSLISRQVLRSDPSLDILVTVNHRRNSVDLRTVRDDIDLSKIAVRNGGGGHPKAAGFPIGNGA